VVNELRKKRGFGEYDVRCRLSVGRSRLTHLRGRAEGEKEESASDPNRLKYGVLGKGDRKGKNIAF